MIEVWTDAAEAGRLDRHGERGSAFAYLPGTPAARAISAPDICHADQPARS